MTRVWRGLALACALLGAACHGATPEETATDTVVGVEVQTSRTGVIREVTAATGVVTAPPGGELVVTAPETARIAALPKAEGDRVRAGDLLVRFEIPSLTAAASASRAGIDQAQARVDNARAAAARLAGLFERGVAARREVEDAERELRESEAALAQAVSASGAASALAGRLVVRARFAGVVAKRWHNPGDLVEPGPSDPILRIIDPSHLEVVAAVPVGELPRIAAGAPATIVNPAGGDPLDATVIVRPAAVEPGSITAPVRLRPSAAKDLTAGMAVQVEILGPEHPAVVLVPPSAVLRDGDTTVVMTVGSDSKAHRHEVELGIVTATAVEIRKGLTAGEKVIVRGHNGLPDGAAVTIE
jgi:RND family efflux transporter MFP subunit